MAASMTGAPVTEHPELFKSTIARYNGLGGCGHTINKGDVIGYDAGGGRLRCQNCWRIMREKMARERDRAYRERMKIE